jgi:tRNA threonylcarbamoyladenosine biosynthesis protein TsaB
MAVDEPRFLLIETTGRVGRVGLAAGRNLVAERELDAKRRHARDLAPAVDALLRDGGWRPRHLAVVIVCLGPGSYTGLRVGIMSAKALAYAVGCAVVGVPTFEVIAQQADVTADRLDVIADAQQEKLYVQPFARPSPTAPFAPTASLAILAGRQWAGARSPATAVSGPGLRVAAKWLPAETPTASTVRRDPTLAALLAAGLLRWLDGQRDDPLRLEPIYLRPSSAEEQWDRRTDSPAVNGRCSSPQS